MFTRSMNRKRRDSRTPEAPPPVKRRRETQPTLSPIEALKKRILMAVDSVQPRELGLALAVRTRQTSSLTYSIGEINNLYALLILPSIEKYEHQRAALLDCLRLLLGDERFTLPLDLMQKVVEDRRQLVDIVQLLITGSPTHKIPPALLEGLSYATIMAANDRVLKLIIAQPDFQINQQRDCPPVMSLRPLHLALHINANHYSANLVPALLKHADIEPDLRTRSIGNEWMTAVGIADKSYTTATNDDERTRAARHARLLVLRDDVDIHTINDRKDVLRGGNGGLVGMVAVNIVVQEENGENPEGVADGDAVPDAQVNGVAL